MSLEAAAVKKVADKLSTKHALSFKFRKQNFKHIVHRIVLRNDGKESRAHCETKDLVVHIVYDIVCTCHGLMPPRVYCARIDAAMVVKLFVLPLFSCDVVGIECPPCRGVC